ncbi:hypothetical protein FE697_007205 [Mumia zhuanghuii]|uniref:Pyridoxamine 5'-phosphate oxidase n=2 Tax=Mumia TaxID=1546255 RepID=A0ABW1QN61_9ACTN|nr:MULTISPECIES: hypothetical protein [Mumia]KAA1423391.1 hypothetical protein FE697_007205 [Mumia zhuanghuii]
MESRVAPNHSAPDPPERRLWQRVLNECWPLTDKGGNGHARGIPTRPAVPVMVWLDFERDGVCWLRAQAVRWHGRHVCVMLTDDRLPVAYVWVEATDVQRT